MFIELIPESLKAITYPDFSEENISLPENKEVFPKKETPSSPEGNTNTYNKTNNTSEINTTTNTECYAFVSLFEDSGLNLIDKDIKAVICASKNDFNKCEKAINLLKTQTQEIHNVTGWLIEAVKNDYSKNTRVQPSHNSRNFCTFQQRNYDYSALEKVLYVT